MVTLRPTSGGTITSWVAATFPATITETIRDLKVPAVFVEPNLARRASVLRQVAADLSVQVCMLYGDTFNPDDPGYIPMMRHNADELARCLA
ncbi:hypothetical protein Aple_009880 [Acrocarpospora pleiomorpha]|uniref:Uncharacterized protein n=1 Tax=Acrocarpospora pleiomorpha TaxID=90975 RepID=A0A5M3XGH3_9ACTN|nr:zinc ABC transporter substrate-binding protein [Acrocarpospora pleiomorpha]GES18093.1 hypothetical protein Aple_009880 [Acrocarpospora pleiomorpha]